MSSQPANDSIQVFRRVRAQRNDSLHTSVKQRSVGVSWSELYIVPPGEEIQVYNKLDDSFKTDAFRFGHPVTVLPREKTSLAEVITQGDGSDTPLIEGLNFPVGFTSYYRDSFIEKNSDNITDDLHQDVRDVSADPKGLFEVV